jgi:hypothetical protein
MRVNEGGLRLRGRVRVDNKSVLIKWLSQSEKVRESVLRVFV